MKDGHGQKETGQDAAKNRFRAGSDSALIPEK